MTTEELGVIHDAIEASLSGSRTFPEISHQLIGIGIARYDVDLVACEFRYYATDDTFYSAPKPLEFAIAQEFSAEAVAAAVGKSQRGEHTYTDFLNAIADAGCVGYTVYFNSARVRYLGRAGDYHEEPMPFLQ